METAVTRRNVVMLSPDTDQTGDSRLNSNYHRLLSPLSLAATDSLMFCKFRGGGVGSVPWVEFVVNYNQLLERNL